MSETDDRPSLEPGHQVLVSFGERTNVVNYLPETTERAVIVGIRSTPEEIETALKSHSIDPTTAVVIPVGLNNPTYRGRLELTEVIRPSDLATLGRVISTRLEETRGTDAWLVIDDLVVLFMYCGDQRVLGFLRSIADRVRENDTKAIYGIDRGALSEQTYNRLSVICDYRVELRAS